MESTIVVPMIMDLTALQRRKWAISVVHLAIVRGVEDQNLHTAMCGAASNTPYHTDMEDVLVRWQCKVNSLANAIPHPLWVAVQLIGHFVRTNHGSTLLFHHTSSYLSEDDLFRIARAVRNEEYKQ